MRSARVWNCRRRPLSADFTALNERLVAAYAETEIEVDAAFGEWDPAAQAVVAGGGVGEVPTTPQPGSGDLDLSEPEQP